MSPSVANTALGGAVSGGTLIRSWCSPLGDKSHTDRVDGAVAEGRSR
jgi:hypothetical protein